MIINTYWSSCKVPAIVGFETESKAGGSVIYVIFINLSYHFVKLTVTKITALYQKRSVVTF